MECILDVAGSDGVHLRCCPIPNSWPRVRRSDLEDPDRVLIGGQTRNRAGSRADLVEVYAHWVPRDRILTTSVWSSELSKLAANAFLAQRIAPSTPVGALRTHGGGCRGGGRAIGMDARIGSRFLNASVGFGGSCFQKDILNLVYSASTTGERGGGLLGTGGQDEHYQEGRFVHRMIAAMFNTVAGKRIAVLGFAFKADTGDTRELRPGDPPGAD